jgi:hypothetical protein
MTKAELFQQLQNLPDNTWIQITVPDLSEQIREKQLETISHVTEIPEFSNPDEVGLEMNTTSMWDFEVVIHDFDPADGVVVELIPTKLMGC